MIWRWIWVVEAWVLHIMRIWRIWMMCGVLHGAVNLGLVAECVSCLLLLVAYIF